MFFAFSRRFWRFHDSILNLGEMRFGQFFRVVFAFFFVLLPVLPRGIFGPS